MIKSLFVINSLGLVLDNQTSIIRNLSVQESFAPKIRKKNLILYGTSQAINTQQGESILSISINVCIFRKQAY